MPVIHDLLKTALDLAADGHPGNPQGDAAASYAGFMESQFAFVDWSNSARDIHNQVRTHRYMRSPDRPLAESDTGWLHIVRTSLDPAEGQCIVCGDSRPLWIVESGPARSPGQATPAR